MVWREGGEKLVNIKYFVNEMRIIEMNKVYEKKEGRKK